ncbi:MAG: carbamoyltransferase C-terminal domain-containing protein [Candidatus Micrarchaeaceae archaeon]
MYILGVWDGHDAGAALLDGNRIIYAANEERFTKRKLEVKFPFNAINGALKFAGLKPSDIGHVSFTTTEFTKTLERVFPSMKENYYMFRRRKILKPRFENERHKLKYTLTKIGVLPLCSSISSHAIAKNLKHMGFTNFKLHVVDHHTAHAAAAAFTAPFNDALIITIDGLGDGLSGSISTLSKGNLERHSTIKAVDSIGIFYEQVTNIVGMRELEDEGKVMAMADYSYPFEYENNRLKDFFEVKGTAIHAKYSPLKQFELLQRIAWQIPREQFSYMAQQVLENVLTSFTQNALDEYGIGDVAFAGGIFSNVKANMKIRNLDKLRHWFVFPHMGDGGMALGGALYTNYKLDGISHYDFSAYLGDAYEENETEEAIKKDKDLEYEHESTKEQPSHAADLINSGNYIFWFQGRMEYGPRALGNRSILAPSNSDEVKDKLNLYVKKREWFQPFAPSLLESDANLILEYDSKGADKFMTNTYYVRKEVHDSTRAVTNIDKSARPQMVGAENKQYMDLLQNIRRKTGYGIVLNTSFNIHGMPIVMSPDDALKTMKQTSTKYMFINGIFVTNRKGA